MHAVFAAGVTSAQTFYIGPAGGLWSVGSNWDAGVPPKPGADVVVGNFIPGRQGDVSVVFDAAHTPETRLNSVTLDETGTSGSVIVNQTGASTAMAVENRFTIGTTSRGSVYNQSAGTSGLSTTRLELGEPGGLGTYNLSGGTLRCGSENIGGPVGIGVFNQSGGTNIPQFLYVGFYPPRIGGDYRDPIRGTFNLTGGNLLVGSGGASIGKNQEPRAEPLAIFNQSGGVVTIELSSLNVRPDGAYNFSGGQLNVRGGVFNAGRFNVLGVTYVFEDIYRNQSPGVFSVTGSNISFREDFTNNGGYTSHGSSTQTFANLTAGAAGYFVGGAGEIFEITRNFTNNSTDGARFNLSSAHLRFSGNGVQHRVAWPAADRGADPSGFDNNFAVGVLSLASGNSLALLDGNSTPGCAIYVRVLQLADGVGQIANIGTSGDVSIYYDENHPGNAYLERKTYPLSGGGSIKPAPARASGLGNISTRLSVGTGENVLIGGFILQGSAARKVVIRGVGPSLTQSGISNVLADPILTLFDSNGAAYRINDNWKNSPQRAEIEASGVAPTNDLESAILETLAPGSYTASVRGSGDSSGIGLVEVYDLGTSSEVRLANISTRGLVQTGDNVLIGGLIVLANSEKVLVRALGPSLAEAGVANALSDPTLEIYDGNGASIMLNDNWEDNAEQRAQIEATGIPPKAALESALITTLPPGAYTAVVRGKENGTGVGLVEVYNLR